MKWEIFHQRIALHFLEMFNVLHYCQIVKNDREQSWNMHL